MSIKKKLEILLYKIVKNIVVEHDYVINLEHPNVISHGDFATNIAMVLANKLRKNPLDIANKIVTEFSLKNIKEVESVSVANPGFINIKLSKTFFEKNIKEILFSEIEFGDLDIWKGKTILVEHSSPNLFKPFHIGHMMNNTIGESIVRLCKISGANVEVISYPSDVSLGIGKAVWQLMEYGVEELNNYKTISEKMEFLGKCYSNGTKAYKKYPDLEIRIREITQDIYEHRDTEAYRVYKIGKDLNLDYFIRMTTRLGSVFDSYIFESEAGEVGKKIVYENLGKVFTESNEAIIFEPNEDDLKNNKSLHTRVFINKDGNPTYEAKDTGLLKLKFDRYDPDLSIFITDNEQGPYFEVVKVAAGKINEKWEKNTKHMTHGRLKFNGMKISSRLGSVPLVSDIIDSVNDAVYKKTIESGREISTENSDVISIAAIKYTILRTQAGKNIDFNLEKSLSFEGDSGPYLQYTYARCMSILRKAKKEGLRRNLNQSKNWKIIDLERFLYRLPDIFELAFLNYAPQNVTGYVTEIAQIFNSWYGDTKIIDINDENTGYKLALVEATSIVIKKSLWSLGIEVLEEM